MDSGGWEFRIIALCVRKFPSLCGNAKFNPSVALRMEPDVAERFIEQTALDGAEYFAARADAFVPAKRAERKKRAGANAEEKVGQLRLPAAGRLRMTS